MSATDARELADGYTAMWNESEVELRRAAIRELWAEDGIHGLHAPQEIRQVASGPGFPASTLDARGHQAPESRVARAYEDFVGGRGFRFRARGDAVRLHNVVKFTWEMFPADGGPVAGGGLEFVVLDDDGRIQADYMFPGL